MNRFVALSLVALLALGLSAAPANAGFGGHHGGGVMMHGRDDGGVFPLLLRAIHPTPDQRAKLADIMKAHRAKLGPLFKDLRAAQDDLAGKLLGSAPVTAADLAPTLQKIGQLRQQLMQEWAQAALEARAVLTPDQLAKAAQTKQRLDALRAEMRDLLGPPGDGPED